MGRDKQQEQQQPKQHCPHVDDHNEPDWHPDQS